jgi:hypothetical protein
MKRRPGIDAFGDKIFRPTRDEEHKEAYTMPESESPVRPHAEKESTVFS